MKFKINKCIKTKGEQKRNARLTLWKVSGAFLVQRQRPLGGGYVSSRGLVRTLILPLSGWNTLGK